MNRWAVLFMEKSVYKLIVHEKSLMVDSFVNRRLLYAVVIDWRVMRAGQNWADNEKGIACASCVRNVGMLVPKQL